MSLTEQLQIPAVLDANARQRIFRNCLEALARPGTRHPMTVPEPASTRVDSLPATAAPIVALADLMTPIAAADAYAEGDLGRLSALTHAPRGRLEDARFVLAYAPVTPDLLLRINRGTSLRPHRAALVCLPARFDTGARLRFTGPGIAGFRDIQIDGLDRDFVSARAEAVAQFPRGVDCLLVDPAGVVMGLPRTTKIEELT